MRDSDLEAAMIAARAFTKTEPWLPLYSGREAAMILERAFTETEPWLPLYGGREAAEILQRAFQPTLGLDGIIAGLMPLESARDMVDRIAGSFAAENVRLSRLMSESLSAWPWRGWPEVEQRPRRRPYTPERPPEPIEVVQVREPDEVERLNAALTHAGLTWAQAHDLLLRHVPKSKPGQKEPDFETKLALAAEYEELKRTKGISQETFVHFHAHKIYHCSLRSFQNYYKDVCVWRKMQGHLG